MKTELTTRNVETLLTKRLGVIADVRPITEGEESQAFAFHYQGRGYIVRLNTSLTGFTKDRYAYEHFMSTGVPIPRVIETVQIDATHAMCISELVPGMTMQDAEEADVVRLLPSLTGAWSAIGNTDISGTQGFGCFDSHGKGPYKSWREYLLSTVDDTEHACADLVGVNEALVGHVAAEFRQLVESCPGERSLVHGDFGSNNVLVDTRAARVTAILDWDEALFGDPLVDIAGAYFWRTWLVCMEKAADYWESQFSEMDSYPERIRCYQLRAGLLEIYDSATAGDAELLEWTQNRCRDLLLDK